MASTSSYPIWKYDVFLSFCGKDTRRNFVSHLYRELHRLGINTFKDDEKLERGTYITEKLLKAIKESKFAVVIISENYASSSFCLKELVEIVECSKNGSLTILPIFYNVDPSHVRKQKGSFGEAFKKHDKENFKDVDRWKEALTEVANITGDDSKNWKDDAELIQKISVHILNWRNATLQSDFVHLVGIHVNMQELEPLLNLGSNDEVRVIGICGMGGIGKTEIARYIYKRHYHQFQAFCFIDKVKDLHKSGKRYLQQHFLAEILQEKDLKIPSFIEGSKAIKGSLGHLKVLIILDDVDNQDQLDILVGNIDSFGRGSRIIITSRDKDYFCDGYMAYDVKYLDDNNASQLFCLSAFGKRYPEDDFLDLSTRAVQYACGLPLALKVWGAFLKGKIKEEQEMAQLELQKYLHSGIREVLTVSYDGLHEKAKQIFLYIACLLSHRIVGSLSHEFGNIDRLETLLGARYEDIKYWIRVLANKSLLHVSSYGKIEMHDLLQQMGEEIICLQSIDQPGKRKFLFNPAEIYEILAFATGTETVEAISLNMSEINDLIIHKKAFKRMYNLRFLNIYWSEGSTDGSWHGHSSKVQVQCLDHFPNKLIFLRWDQFPLRTLPRGSHYKCLVELNMPGSNLETLWEGPMPLWNLKKMDLQRSVNLKKVPDLSMASSLEEIKFRGCSRIVDVSSIEGLKKLERLYFDACAMLEYFPSCHNMTSLQFLSLSGCCHLKRFPGGSPSIRFLYLRNCRMLKNFPSHRGMTALEKLYLSGCSSLKVFPEVPPGIKELDLSFTAVQEVPYSIGLLPNLNRLNMLGCKIKSIPSDVEKLTYLEHLNLTGCGRLTDIPGTIKNINSLQTLCITNCNLLQSLPELPKNLQYLEASGSLSLAVINTVNIVPTEDSFCSNCFQMVGNSESHQMPCFHYLDDMYDRYTLTIPVPCNRHMVGFLMSFAVAVETSFMGIQITYEDRPLSSLSGMPLWPWCSTITGDPTILGFYFEKPQENTKIKFKFSLRISDAVSSPLKMEIKDFRVRPIFIEDCEKWESNRLAAQSTSSYCHIKPEDLLNRKAAAENIGEQQDRGFRRIVIITLLGLACLALLVLSNSFGTLLY